MLNRFSSRMGRLSHVFLKDRLAGAKSYRRIAGYFRSSIFELVDEEINGIELIEIVCNSDLDPRDITASRLARETAIKEKWNEGFDEIDSLMHRKRYKRLYELLKSGKVKVQVVAASDAPFLHGKAGVIEGWDGTKTSFIGSLNETREGWQDHYELVWEDASAEAVAWVEAEFKYLWARSVPLPDAIVEEVGRLSRKVEVELETLQPADIAAAALVEAPLYRKGEELKPWQRAFVGLFLEHRESYGVGRFLLADEVGVGKTLSLATAAMVSCLLGDGPAVILAPATLCQQWQVELKDKLGLPSAVWLSNAKVWRDANGHVIKTRGAEDIRRCPFQIGIVSTGLIVQGAAEAGALLDCRFGTVVLDEAHKARKSRGIGASGEPNRLMGFMLDVAKRAKHVILGTATPVQTDVEELWDLLEVLNQGAEHVLGRYGSPWRRPTAAIPVLTGEKVITEESEAWNWLRNPLPARREHALFDLIRSDLRVRADNFSTDRPVTDLEDFTRAELRDAMEGQVDGVGFLPGNNPILRHTVLRKRATLEDMGLLERIAVDIWPSEHERLSMFDGVALHTSAEFDAAYAAAKDFTGALRRRVSSAGFMQSMMQQRICSSFASGMATAKRLLEKRRAAAVEGEDEAAQHVAAGDFPEILEAERFYLAEIVRALGSKPTDPKLDAVLLFLQERGWLELGCIIFSQYYDTAYWIAESLTARLPGERVALYAGADKSGVFFDGEWRSVEREEIKTAVRERKVRLLAATDAACEGLNLQTLGTLINVDLPWNPARLEQRIGRIKRFGQIRPRVDMLNLVYSGTNDEKVYQALSRRMRDRYDLFGSLPDTIEDEWIEDIENLEEYLSQFTQKKRRANAFDLRYGKTVMPEGQGWELCEKVLARRDVVERLSVAW
ncbi:MAG: phospholipase D-like domain-containing anti-phage protein [Bryobacteraceae bacterium]|nr:phospholipase D-like domain-containing anti-phage protein [Bryobacteraceae bacterium]